MTPLCSPSTLTRISIHPEVLEVGGAAITPDFMYAMRMCLNLFIRGKCYWLIARHLAHVNLCSKSTQYTAVGHLPQIATHALAICAQKCV